MKQWPFHLLVYSVTARTRNGIHSDVTALDPSIMTSIPNGDELFNLWHIHLTINKLVVARGFAGGTWISNSVHHQAWSYLDTNFIKFGLNNYFVQPAYLGFVYILYGCHFRDADESNDTTSFIKICPTPYTHPKTITLLCSRLKILAVMWKYFSQTF